MEVEVEVCSLGGSTCLLVCPMHSLVCVLSFCWSVRGCASFFFPSSGKPVGSNCGPKLSELEG